MEHCFLKIKRSPGYAPRFYKALTLSHPIVLDPLFLDIPENKNHVEHLCPKKNLKTSSINLILPLGPAKQSIGLIDN